MDWSIVLDSSGNLSPDSIDNSGDIEWSIAPLTIIIDGKEYVDDENLDLADMKRAMKEYKGASGSACPSVGDFAARFRKAKNTICITISSELSGSYESALQAKELVGGEDGSKNIHVVDSRSAGSKMILIAEEAERLIHEGLSFTEVVAKIEEYAKSIRLLFSLARFDNLIKSGRMPRYQGMLGQLLNIRPIAKATEIGTIEVLEKPRGEKAMLRRLVELMQEFKNLEGMRVFIDHCDALDVVTRLKEMIEEAAKVKEVRLYSTTGLCSYYADDKGFIISF